MHIVQVCPLTPPDRDPRPNTLESRAPHWPVESVDVLYRGPWLPDGLLFLRLRVRGHTSGKVQGHERPSRSTGVEYEDAGRDGLSELTGGILGSMPFGCGGEEVDMERNSEFSKFCAKILVSEFGESDRIH